MSTRLTSFVKLALAGALSVAAVFASPSSSANASTNRSLQPIEIEATRGEAFVTLRPTSTGITWSGWVTGFYPNREITYHWRISRNWVPFYANQHGGYFTNSRGSHSRLPSGFPQAIDCGPGLYQIELWVTDNYGNQTPSDWALVVR
jgi:hypothetical protein